MDGAAQNDCRDPASGIQFQHYGEAAGDMLGISVEVPGRSDPEIAATAGVFVPDRASFDALRTSFVSLPAAPAFAGLVRCLMIPGGLEDDPSAVAGFAVLHRASRKPVAFIFGALEDAMARQLEGLQEHTQVLLAILVLVSPDFDCLPVQ